MRKTNKEGIPLLAKKLAEEFPKGALLALYGDLGAGKTTLAKAVAHFACGLDEASVQSPTFTYMHVYDNLIHFDLWRLKNEDEFLALGLEEYLMRPGWVIIEWPERIESLLPPETVRIVLC